MVQLRELVDPAVLELADQAELSDFERRTRAVDEAVILLTLSLHHYCYTY